jgi:RHS repeat-associated protein
VTGAGSSSYTRDPQGTLIDQRTSGGGRNYYLFDALGSVTALTDSTGAVAATYSYDPWGVTTATGTAAAGNPFRYTGAFYDTATSLYKMGARYYNPLHARWSQPDPVHQPTNLSEATATSTGGTIRST